MATNGKKVSWSYKIDEEFYDLFSRLAGVEGLNVSDAAIEEAIRNWVFSLKDAYPRIFLVFPNVQRPQSKKPATTSSECRIKAIRYASARCRFNIGKS
jgi:hypothetical protein